MSVAREKNPMLRATGMLLGALCVLLLAGGLPWGGIEAVYGGGLMRVLGGLAGGVAVWAAWKLSAGHRLRMLVGRVALFFVVSGVGVLLHCWEKAQHCASLGGGMWFGAVGMGCLAVVGVLFSVIFGYLAHLCLRVEKLWLAVAHLGIVLVVVGAFVDVCCEQRLAVTRHVGAPSVLQGKSADKLAPFEVEVKDLHVERYASSESYTLLVHRSGRWLPIAVAKREGDSFRCGQEIWPVENLRALPGGEGRYLALPGSPARVLVQQPGQVREYRAVCRFSPTLGEGEGRDVTLRVNHPASLDHWQIYLMNCSADGRQVQLLLRCAPGRPLVFAGLLGVLLSCFAWAFRDKRSTRA